MTKNATMSKQGDVHVMPNFGRAHELSHKCWCHPVEDAKIALEQPTGPQVWVHNPEN